MEPAQREGEQPDALTLRAALLESNNAAAADLQQRVGSRAVLRLAGDAGLSGSARRAVAGARHRPRLAARSHRRVHDVSRRRRRWRGRAACISVFDAGGRAGVRPAGRARAACISPAVAFQMTSMLRDVVERGTGAPARALGVRGPVGGKTGTTDDYHDAWFVGFSTVGRRRRLGRLRSAGADRPRGVRRARRAADLGRLHEADGARSCRHASSRCPTACTARSCAACRTCGRSRAARPTPSTSRTATRVPSALCPIHRGTLEAAGGARRRRVFPRRSAAKSPASSAADRTMAEPLRAPGRRRCARARADGGRSSCGSRDGWPDAAIEIADLVRAALARALTRRAVRRRVLRLLARVARRPGAAARDPRSAASTRRSSCSPAAAPRRSPSRR